MTSDFGLSAYGWHSDGDTNAKRHVRMRARRGVYPSEVDNVATITAIIETLDRSSRKKEAIHACRWTFKS